MPSRKANRICTPVKATRSSCSSSARLRSRTWSTVSPRDAAVCRDPDGSNSPLDAVGSGGCDRIYAFMQVGFPATEEANHMRRPGRLHGLVQSSGHEEVEG